MDLKTAQDPEEPGQLAVLLAEYLRSLMLLNAAELQKTMAEMQQILPFDIRAHKTDKSIQIKIEEIAPVDNRMSLKNLVHGLTDSSDELQKLTDTEYDSDTTEELPYTPAELESDTLLPTRYDLDMFDEVEWTSWMNGDILYVLDREP